MQDHEQESAERGLPLEQVVTDTSDRRAALTWLGIGAVLVVLLIVVALQDVRDVPWWVYATLGAGAAGSLAASLWKVRVWVGWGNPQLHLPSSDPLRLGDRVTARFRRRARGRSELGGLEVTARLRVEERAQLTGRASAIITHTVDELPVEVVLTGADERLVEADLLLDVPLNHPPSMDLGANQLHWELQVDISGPRAPDDRTTFPLEVAPQLADRHRRESLR